MKRIISVLLFAALAFTSSFAQEAPKPGYSGNLNEKYTSGDAGLLWAPKNKVTNF